MVYGRENIHKNIPRPKKIPRMIVSMRRLRQKEIAPERAELHDLLHSVPVHGASCLSVCVYSC